GDKNRPESTPITIIKSEPDFQDYADQISRGIPPEISQSLNEVDYQKILLALSHRRNLSLAHFFPSAGKSSQDENVNIIREKLSEAGEILKAMPIINDSKVQFAFLMASESPIDYSRFPQVEWTPLETPQIHQTKQSAAEAYPNASAANEAPLTIRVDLQRLDEIMVLVGELLVTRSRLVNSLERIPALPPNINETLNQTLHQMNRNLSDLNRAVLRARMVPLSDVFNTMPLAVRDLARASGKDVRLVMEGENTEIDRLLVDGLLEPLLHLVRNAVTHGIESAQERSEQGKPAQGTLRLSGQPEGDQVLITVADDGRGVDVDMVRVNAFQRGWIKEDQALSNADVLELICRPGLSTKSSADFSAGRGLGMNIVHQRVTSLGGNINLHTVPGQGTTFTLRFPMTLTVIHVILVDCGDERFAISQNAVSKIIEIDPANIVSLEGGELYPYQDDSLNLIRLTDLFHLPVHKSNKFLYGVISGEENRRTCLVVDKLIGMRDIVVRTIHDPLIIRPGILGAAELGDGQLILVIDVPALLSFASYPDILQTIQTKTRS
ncbi:MAG: chemotaxis protein CheA, partial [Omnitrophica WOR_2 bacterium]